ncbi:DUF6456 domain-containing protein [Polycladidibacter hongkongensis]|uniref:DUF6456 domain-containing protein n=1 Tax=Polycladidibacter hongkongensis TaxID=1647556 RepID=UPI000832CA07|nr:DUF6456 domain-containing protein [Pseudovibrio hongkongensis]
MSTQNPVSLAGFLERLAYSGKASAKQFLQDAGQEGKQLLILAEQQGLILSHHEYDFTISPFGKSALRRLRTLDDKHAKNVPSRKTAPAQQEKRMMPPVIKGQDTPLAWLASRRDAKGFPLIDEAQVMAGERLRSTFDQAQKQLSIKSNWSAQISYGGPSKHDYTFESQASRHLQATFSVIGPELSPVLLAVCCHGIGLQELEKQERWPARSGRIILRLALQRLVSYYKQLDTYSKSGR